MGAHIESVAAQRARRGPLAPGALQLSDSTARACLAAAHRRADELDLLVNAGLYKARNMAEPALASIIQEDIGANPGHPPRHDHHGTFSFDVMNGGCGVLSALQIVDAFVGAGTAQLGLIVAADSDPAPRSSRGFHFPPVGGALLLRHADDGEGFRGFELRTFPEHQDLFEVRVAFDPTAGRRGSSILEVREDPRFAAACIARASEVAAGFLEARGLAPDDVDLLIASAYPSPFAAAVAGAIGIPADRLPRLPRELASAHTAGPIAALVAAEQTGRLQAARTILFVTAGAGVTVGVALYAQGSSSVRIKEP